MMTKTFAIVGTILLAVGCGGGRQAATPPVQERYAAYFHVVPDSAMVVSISPHDGSRDTLRLTAPLRRLVCMSSSYIGFLSALGAGETVVGASGLGYVSDGYVRSHVAEVGYEAAPDYETILSLRPDVLLTYTVSAAEPTYIARLRELGVRVFVLYEHLEGHPLARAEYVQLFGTLTGRMAQADSIFASVEARYLALAGGAAPEARPAAAGTVIPEAIISGAASTGVASSGVAGAGPTSYGSEPHGAASSGGSSSDAPVVEASEAAHPAEAANMQAAPIRKVLLNIPYADQWYVPGRDNYMTRLISDAGGEVLGAKPGSESSVISMEEAVQLASEADFWLNTGWCASKADLYGVNSLFRDFPQEAYNNNLRLTPQGGNDFWESGVVRPDLILEDLVRIFSGHAASDSLHYYRKLE